MAWSRNGSTPITLTASPSLLYNNLTSNDRFLAYARLDEVHLISHASSSGQSTKLDYQDSFPIFQVKWVVVDNRDMLVLTTSSGFQVWDGDARQMLFFFPLSSEVEGSAAIQVFNRGVAGIRGGSDLCVGCSSGEIFVFECNGEDFTKTKTLRGHQTPISALEASQDHLVSGDDSGDVAVWSVHSGYSKECEFKGKGFPCSSVLIRGEVIAAAYVTGNIRVYRITTGSCAIDIAAHSRTISALHLHPTNPVFVSVGEDTFLNVWSWPDFETKSSSEVELLCASQVDDQLLTGAQFVPDGSERIVVASYDSDAFHVWTRT